MPARPRSHVSSSGSRRRSLRPPLSSTAPAARRLCGGCPDQGAGLGVPIAHRGRATDRMFGHGIRWGWVRTNPVKAVPKPSGKPERSVVCLAPAQAVRTGYSPRASSTRSHSSRWSPTRASVPDGTVEERAGGCASSAGSTGRRTASTRSVSCSMASRVSDRWLRPRRRQCGTTCRYRGGAVGSDRGCAEAPVRHGRGWVGRFAGKVASGERRERTLGPISAFA